MPLSMSEDPVEKAKAGFGEAWKAAKSAADGVKKEIEKAGIAKTIDDAGREIARAATSVASHLGSELEELGREIRLKAEGTAAHHPEAPVRESPGDAGGEAGARPAGGSEKPTGGVRIAKD